MGNSLSSENLNKYAEILQEAEKEWKGIVSVPLEFGAQLLNS